MDKNKNGRGKKKNHECICLPLTMAYICLLITYYLKRSGVGCYASVLVASTKYDDTP